MNNNELLSLIIFIICVFIGCWISTEPKYKYCSLIGSIICFLGMIIGLFINNMIFI